MSLPATCVLALFVFVSVASADDPQHETYTQNLPDTEAFLEMVAIPGGEFRMGSPEDEPGRDDDEGPQRKVRIDPFWMSSTEVTWELYDLFLYTGRRNKPDPRLPVDYRPDGVDAVTRPTLPYADPTYGMGHDGFPAISMSHHAAMEFCHWLSVVTGKKYRLPTEAEWEYACRAGTQTPYWFGDDPADLPKHGWFWNNSDDSTKPVGLTEANPWGLYDMHGNVAEWCLDSYHADFYNRSLFEGDSVNPVKLPGRQRYPHAIRGGSFMDDPEDCRSAARAASDPTFNQQDPCVPQSIWFDVDAYHVGFRVVRAVEERELLRDLPRDVVPYVPED